MSLPNRHQKLKEKVRGAVLAAKYAKTNRSKEVEYVVVSFGCADTGTSHPYQCLISFDNPVYKRGTVLFVTHPGNVKNRTRLVATLSRQFEDYRFVATHIERLKKHDKKERVAEFAESYVLVITEPEYYNETVRCIKKLKCCRKVPILKVDHGDCETLSEQDAVSSNEHKISKLLRTSPVTLGLSTSSFVVCNDSLPTETIISSIVNAIMKIKVMCDQQKLRLINCSISIGPSEKVLITRFKSPVICDAEQGI